MTLLCVDVSRWQGTIDFTAVKRAGDALIFMKASQGATGVDPMFAANRAAVRAVGLTSGFYHFAGGGDPLAEADHFCAVVGSLHAGDLLALDWETTAPNPPAWCKTFLDRVTSKLGVKPLIYLNQSGRDGFNWTPVVSGDYGLWLAKYDGTPVQPPSGLWPTVAIKQYTSSGSVPGIGGAVDQDVFYGDATALAAYGYQGADMPLTDADVQKIWWAETKDPATGQPVQIIQLLKNAELAAANAARDAAVARKLAESAAAGVVLTTAEIDAIAAQVAADLAAGYKINVIPPA